MISTSREILECVQREGLGGRTLVVLLGLCHTFFYVFLKGSPIAQAGLKLTS